MNFGVEWFFWRMLTLINWSISIQLMNYQGIHQHKFLILYIVGMCYYITWFLMTSYPWLCILWHFWVIWQNYQYQLLNPPHEGFVLTLLSMIVYISNSSLFLYHQNVIQIQNIKFHILMQYHQKVKFPQYPNWVS